MKTLQQKSSREHEKLISQQLTLKEELVKKKEIFERARVEHEKSKLNLNQNKQLYFLVANSQWWRILKPVRKVAGPLVKHLFGARREVYGLRHKLLSLGFEEKAYKDLLGFAQSGRGLKKKLAAWELAVYHANRSAPADAEKCLEFLEIAEKKEFDENKLSRIAVIKAESLSRVGKKHEAKEILNKVIEKLGASADLYLARANLEDSIVGRLAYANKALELNRTSPIAIDHDAKIPYEGLGNSDMLKEAGANKNDPIITVIVPAYNAADTIHTSLDSMLDQTWKNLEIIVADDCSTDNTTQVVKEYIKKDPRIKLVQASQNGGAYIARNLALKEARGVFVTCNDSDDWSHPERLEVQVQHLLADSETIANTIQLARTSENFFFQRRGNPGYYIQQNMSSLMFRRRQVTETIGYWDSVRFGADSEFIKRIRLVFGTDSLVSLPDSLLSFPKQSDDSLTGSLEFGFRGFFMGARKEYVESQEFFHTYSSTSLFYEFPSTVRPFPIPYPMLPHRKLKKGDPRKLDLVLVGDFRKKPSDDMLESINQMASNYLTIGLLQMNLYSLNPDKKTHISVRELLSDTPVEMLVFGDQIDCKTIYIDDSEVLQNKQLYIPTIHSSNIYVRVVDKPKTSRSIKNLVSLLDTRRKNLKDYFSGSEVFFTKDPSLARKLGVKQVNDLGADKITKILF